MAQKNYASVRLIEKRSISAQFDRLLFEGSALKEFPDDCDGGYIKLLFDTSGQPLAEVPGENSAKPVVRSFTIVEKNDSRLSIDIVRGKNFGVAAKWADGVEPGDAIVIVGPGKAQKLPPDYDSYVIVGDETAIPAVVVQLLKNPTIQGKCFLQCKPGVIDSRVIPTAISLFQVNRDTEGHQAIVDAVRASEWPEGRVFVWAACEFEQMRALRRFFRQQRDVSRADMYISSYWKLGETDEGNKLAKKQDAEADL